MIEKFKDAKPCPFCGWNDIIIGSFDDGRFYVRCGFCGAENTNKSLEKIKVNWNRRAHQ